MTDYNNRDVAFKKSIVTDYNNQKRKEISTKLLPTITCINFFSFLMLLFLLF